MSSTILTVRRMERTVWQLSRSQAEPIRVIEKENVWMGFPHLYYPSNPSFADHFVKKQSNT